MQNIVSQFATLDGSDEAIKISNDGNNYIELQTIRKLQHENRRGKIYKDDILIPLHEYDWLTQKQEKIKNMTLQELKDAVRALIGKAKMKEAIEEIVKWAHENNQEQLKNDIALLKGDSNDLSRDKMLGLLSNSEANIHKMDWRIRF